jgi:hypothetical protein
VSSFEQIFSYGPGEEPAEEPEPPEWIGPPAGELGECAPLSLVVGRSDRAVIALRNATAFSTGVTFDLLALARDLGRREAGSLFHEQHLTSPDEEPPDGFLRIGVELADGSRISNLGNPNRHLWRPEERPTGPILAPHGGSGGSSDRGRTSLHQSYWLWPLPPPGRLRFFAEWPALGVELSSVELDPGPILDAAERSQRLWPR